MSTRRRAMSTKRTTKQRVVATVWMLAVALSAAAPAVAAGVRYDYDPTVAFASWSAWAWRRPAPRNDSSLAEDRIRRSLAAGLAAEGYARVEPEQADFLIEYHIAAHRALVIDDWGPRWRRNVRVDTEPVGVLVVDVLDAATGELAWRGSVSGALENDPDEAEEAARAAIAKLLRKFPPPAR